MSAQDDPVVERIEHLTRELGRKPTLKEVFFRDFTGTGKFRVEELGRPPKVLPRGRRKASG